jgi:hypothetical protein
MNNIDWNVDNGDERVRRKGDDQDDASDNDNDNDDAGGS